MAIAPIDLQTLFTQIDKVGKEQALQKEGQVLHQALQNVQIQRKAEDEVQQVNQTQDTGDGVEKVKDKEGEHGHRQNSGKNKKQTEEDEEELKLSVFSDPKLGRNIDISL
jgi:hypothetical protein